MQGLIVFLSVFALQCFLPSAHSVAVGTCPPDMSGWVDFLTDSDDCNVFYKCDWGNPVKFNCPADLHFNPVLNVCDWPAAAGCGGTTTSTTTTTTTTTETTTVTTPDPIIGTQCTSATCPTAHGTFLTFIPHDTDCTKFCKCSNGTPYEFTCPDGLHFNPTIDVCDWPAAAGCGPTTTSTTSTTSTTTPTTPTTPGSGACAPNVCPPLNGEFVTFLTHSDCTKFCKCDWGVAYEFVCPGGLHFNPVLNVCDWPYRAGC